LPLHSRENLLASPLKTKYHDFSLDPAASFIDASVAGLSSPSSDSSTKIGEFAPSTLCTKNLTSPMVDCP
jgi:hypothetical protein